FRLDHVLQSFSVKELHDEVRLTLVLAELVDSDDVVVTQIPGDNGFVLKAGYEFLIGVQQDLDGHEAVDLGIMGLINAAEGAHAQQFSDLVTTDLSGVVAGHASVSTRKDPCASYAWRVRA